MTVTYLKKATKTPQTGTDETQAIVREMLAKIEEGGEAAALEYGAKLDGYTGSALVTQEQIAEAGKQVSDQLKDDIAFARDRVVRFAEAQRESIKEFETELSPGLWAGQKLIPIETAGCYVPGGRYAHVASAIMSIATAKVAGVENIIACTAPHGDKGPNPAILYAMNLCGADQILSLGGVQGIASMAFGLFTGKKARILVGPGNRFVAEAKRTLYGRVGIDMFAGPTEIAIIADESADPAVVAEDLVSQAEHGPDSPAWLFTTSQELADAVMGRIDSHIETLPEPARSAATAAWRDYGEVILCDTDEEMAVVSDDYAAEHLEVHTKNDAWFTDRLKIQAQFLVQRRTAVQ